MKVRSRRWRVVVTVLMLAALTGSLLPRRNSFLQDRHGNLRHRKGGPRLSLDQGQAGDAEQLRQRSAGGARLSNQVDGGTIRTHEGLHSRREPFHGQGKSPRISLLVRDTECQPLPGSRSQVYWPLRLHSDVANVGNLGPHEHTVQMVGAAMNRGQVSNPQGVFSVRVQLPHNLRSNTNHLRVYRTDLPILYLQVAEHHVFLRFEHVHPK